MELRNIIDEFRKAIIFGKGKGGTGGAKLHNPTISLSGSVITITNPATNGDFCSKFGIYCNGVKVLETASTSVDIEDIPNLPTGTDTFTVTCIGTGMQESNPSNQVYYEYENVFITADDEDFYTEEDYEFISA